jgi:hypothetical protein
MQVCAAHLFNNSNDVSNYWWVICEASVNLVIDFVHIVKVIFTDSLNEILNDLRYQVAIFVRFWQLCKCLLFFLC